MNHLPRVASLLDLPVDAQFKVQLRPPGELVGRDDDRPERPGRVRVLTECPLGGVELTATRTYVVEDGVPEDVARLRSARCSINPPPNYHGEFDFPVQTSLTRRNGHRVTVDAQRRDPTPEDGWTRRYVQTRFLSMVTVVQANTHDVTVTTHRRNLNDILDRRRRNSSPWLCHPPIDVLEEGLPRRNRNHPSGLY